MKIGKRIVSLAICVALAACLCAATAFATNEVDNDLGMGMVNDVSACAECGGETGHLTTCLQYEAECQSSHEVALAAENAGSNLDEEISLLADRTFSSTQPWSGETNITADSIWTFQNGAVATLQTSITVPEGKTLTLKGWGSFARSDTFTGPLFIVEEGGKLVIEGTSKEKPFTIDGMNVIAVDSLIKSSGTLEFKYAVIANGKNRSINAEDKPNGVAGGIRVSAGSLIMDECLVSRNTASANGGGVYCAGTMTISNSTISYNRAMFTEDGTVNAGRGGGFYLAGELASGTLSNVTVDNNAAMYYGGGAQVSNKASLTMDEGTVFSNNKSVLHGAGALHVTADATFTMNGGRMEFNTAQTVGGAIHSSYGCTLNLVKGTISNNTANGRGGGVHVNTGGTVTLGSGLSITLNKVYREGAGISADVDATGDTWSNVVYSDDATDNGYGGGVLVDSGTCTVEGATITQNHAEVGGGGVALVMLNASTTKETDYMRLKVVGFTMTSGSVTSNTTDGNGAGVYLMSNKMKENLALAFGSDIDGYNQALEKLTTAVTEGVPLASISGGTISSNVASNGNGGGLFLDENTKLVISDNGKISSNQAQKGAGAYVESGSVEISGGSMSDNAASADGGALYVSGPVTMSGGSVRSNKAAGNGGGVYVAGSGGFSMLNGSIADNIAKNGGGVFTNGGDVLIESGSMKGNQAIEAKSGEAEAGNEGYGGGAFAKGGSITIGVENCAVETPDAKHASEITHPTIQNNVAVFGGGLAVRGGTVVIHCCSILSNQSSSNGTGMNVFMDGGKVTQHVAGAIIGETENHGMVSIGGELIIDDGTDSDVSIVYHPNYETVYPDWTGLAPEGYYLNLPYCPTNWRNEQATNEGNYTFVGWTSNPLDNNPALVRKKSDYMAIGTPEKITNVNAHADGNVHYYAVWAPKVNFISYAYSINGEVIDDDVKAVFKDVYLSAETEAEYTRYSYESAPRTISIPNPTKPGYKLVGWKILADDGKKSNWDADPIAEEGVSVLSLLSISTPFEKIKSALSAPAGTQTEELKKYLGVMSIEGSISKLTTEQNFGDITLVAVFEPEYAGLTISKENATVTDAGQSFLFVVSGSPYDTGLSSFTMTVAVHGNGKAVLTQLPVGDYAVTELKAWSWRYSPEAVDGDVSDSGAASPNAPIDWTKRTVQLNDPTASVIVSYPEPRSDHQWLSGESYGTFVVS
ncbi:MAG: hypothetical protein IJO87_01580 [Eggerthellaceae bacterium]|nr:hypothetical protein [Eggerthellaceae bacterium]